MEIAAFEVNDIFWLRVDDEIPDNEVESYNLTSSEEGILLEISASALTLDYLISSQIPQNIHIGGELFRIEFLTAAIEFPYFRIVPEIRVEDWGANSRTEFWVCFNIRFYYSHWDRPWTVRRFRQEISAGASKLRTRTAKVEFRDEDSFVEDIAISLLIKSKDVTLKEEITRGIKALRELLNVAERNLQEEINESSIVSHFNFPEEIRTSCEQYLLYFVQFLKDVGVTASAEVKHEAGQSGKVLFSVTPEGGKEALDKVRQALEVYLNLAQKPNMNPDFSAPLEVQRLQSQVLHFQSQMMMVQATLQQTQAAFQQSQATIDLKDALIKQLQEKTVFDQVQQPLNQSETEERIKQLQILNNNAPALDDPKAFIERTRQWVADKNTTSTLTEYLTQCQLESPSFRPLPGKNEL